MQNAVQTSPAEKNNCYISPLGAWALSFGCAVGWGAFGMPGNTFLPIAGPAGTALGMAAGALVMLVMERKKEISILKSLGGSSNGIALSFIITGTVTGALGVLFGLPLGLFCSLHFSQIMAGIEFIVNCAAKVISFVSSGNLSDFVPVHLLDEAFYLQNFSIVIPLPKILLIALGTIVLSLLVSLIPALKAGKEKPIETLRKI